MSKILIISHRYYPELNARAFRWTSLAEYFAQQGHSVFVLTSAIKGFPKREVKNGVTITRTIDFTNLLFQRVSGAKTNSQIQTVNSSKKSVVFALLRNLYNKVLKSLYWPDQEFLWIRPTTSAAKKIIQENKVDNIITVARPFSSHIVGLKLKRKFENLKWICDIGDPFSFDKQQRPNNLYLYSGINRKKERQIFLNSGKISVTTKETRVEYVKHLNVNKEIIHIIPPLFSLTQEMELNSHNLVRREGNSSIVLMFFGTLYKDIRNPEFLLKLIKEYNKTAKKKLILHFVGSFFDCGDIIEKYKKTISEEIVTSGKVERSEVLSLMHKADILVNIGNKTTYQLPSKIIEYISTGKRILNISSFKEDSSSYALKRYSPSLTIVEEEVINKNTIQKLGLFIDSEKRIDTTEINNLLKKHSIEKIASNYLELLNS